MRGFQPRSADGAKEQRFADGGFVQGIKRAFGMDEERNAQIAAYRARAAAEKAQQQAQAQQQTPQPQQRAVTQYSGMSATQRREKELGLADGGRVRPRGFVAGPGTGTSDSIPAQLSNGEYVLPADTVRAVGVDKLDALREATHKPVRGFVPKAAPEQPRQFFADGGEVEDKRGIFPYNHPDAGANVYGGAIDAAKSAVSAAANPQGGQPLVKGAAQMFGRREELQQQGRERWDASVAARQPAPAQPAQPVGLPAAAAAPTPRAQFVADQNQKLAAANTQLAERTAQLNELYKPAPNSPTNTFPANRMPVENEQPQQVPTAPAVTSGFASAQDGMTNDFGRQPSSPTSMAAAAPSTAPKTPASDPQSRINEQMANAQRQRAEGIAAVQRGQAYDSITQQQRQQAYDTWQSTRQPGILPQPQSDMRQQEAEKSYSELLAGRSTSVPQQTSQPVGTAAAAPTVPQQAPVTAPVQRMAQQPQAPAFDFDNFQPAPGQGAFRNEQTGEVTRLQDGPSPTRDTRIWKEPNVLPRSDARPAVQRQEVRAPVLNPNGGVFSSMVDFTNQAGQAVQAIAANKGMRNDRKDALDQQRVGLDAASTFAKIEQGDRALGIDGRRADTAQDLAALQADELGLKREAQGFQTRAAKRLEDLQNSYQSAKTPEERAGIARQLRDLQAKDAAHRMEVVRGKTDLITGQSSGDYVVVQDPNTGEVRQIQMGAAPAPQAMPEAGEVRNGYRYKGGNPNDKASWQKL